MNDKDKQFAHSMDVICRYADKNGQLTDKQSKELASALRNVCVRYRSTEWERNALLDKFHDTIQQGFVNSYNDQMDYESLRADMDDMASNTSAITSLTEDSALASTSVSNVNSQTELDSKILSVTDNLRDADPSNAAFTFFEDYRDTPSAGGIDSDMDSLSGLVESVKSQCDSDIATIYSMNKASDQGARIVSSYAQHNLSDSRYMASCSDRLVSQTSKALSYSERAGHYRNALNSERVESTKASSADSIRARNSSSAIDRYRGMIKSLKASNESLKATSQASSSSSNSMNSASESDSERSSKAPLSVVSVANSFVSRADVSKTQAHSESTVSSGVAHDNDDGYRIRIKVWKTGAVERLLSKITGDDVTKWSVKPHLMWYMFTIPSFQDTIAYIKRRIIPNRTNPKQWALKIRNLQIGKVDDEEHFRPLKTLDGIFINHFTHIHGSGISFTCDRTKDDHIAWLFLPSKYDYTLRKKDSSASEAPSQASSASLASSSSAMFTDRNGIHVFNRTPDEMTSSSDKDK